MLDKECVLEVRHLEPAWHCLVLLLTILFIVSLSYLVLADKKPATHLRPHDRRKLLQWDLLLLAMLPHRMLVSLARVHGLVLLLH